jgi:hypothetical protein
VQFRQKFLINRFSSLGTISAEKSETDEQMDGRMVGRTDGRQMRDDATISVEYFFFKCDRIKIVNREFSNILEFSNMKFQFSTLRRNKVKF